MRNPSMAIMPMTLVVSGALLARIAGNRGGFRFTSYNAHMQVARSEVRS
jgi:hypothetical protein